MMIAPAMFVLGLLKTNMAGAVIIMYIAVLNFTTYIAILSML